MLANVVVTLVVFSRDERIMALATIPAPFAMLAFKFYCKRAFDHDLHYYRRSLTDSETLPYRVKRRCETRSWQRDLRIQLFTSRSWLRWWLKKPKPSWLRSIVDDSIPNPATL